ncbi:unnamed protein product [Amoebophrya sp. A120]|nr:unnamed protein product [Amoebophrya sp. A120]|eukprot:GSA120T00022142001.1
MKINTPNLGSQEIGSIAWSLVKMEKFHLAKSWCEVVFFQQSTSATGLQPSTMMLTTTSLNARAVANLVWVYATATPKNLSTTSTNRAGSKSFSCEHQNYEPVVKDQKTTTTATATSYETFLKVQLNQQPIVQQFLQDEAALSQFLYSTAKLMNDFGEFSSRTLKNRQLLRETRLLKEVANALAGKRQSGHYPNCNSTIKSNSSPCANQHFLRIKKPQHLANLSWALCVIGGMDQLLVELLDPRSLPRGDGTAIIPHGMNYYGNQEEKHRRSALHAVTDPRHISALWYVCKRATVVRKDLLELLIQKTTRTSAESIERNAKMSYEQMKTSSLLLSDQDILLRLFALQAIARCCSVELEGGGVVVSSDSNELSAVQQNEKKLLVRKFVLEMVESLLLVATSSTSGPASAVTTLPEKEQTRKKQHPATKSCLHADDLGGPVAMVLVTLAAMDKSGEIRKLLQEHPALLQTVFRQLFSSFVVSPLQDEIGALATPEEEIRTEVLLKNGKTKSCSNHLRVSNEEASHSLHQAYRAYLACSVLYPELIAGVDEEAELGAYSQVGNRENKKAAPVPKIPSSLPQNPSPKSSTTHDLLRRKIQELGQVSCRGKKSSSFEINRIENEVPLFQQQRKAVLQKDVDNRSAGERKSSSLSNLEIKNNRVVIQPEFFVDLVVNGKLCIEVNGPEHYFSLLDSCPSSTMPTTSTTRRLQIGENCLKRKIAEKLGYAYLEFDAVKELDVKLKATDCLQWLEEKLKAKWI